MLEQKLRWSRKDQEILVLSNTYVAYEATLPPEQQLKDVSLARIGQVLVDANVARQAISDSEATRVKEGAIFRTTLGQVRDALRQARRVLGARYLDDVSPLVDWGFTVVISRGKPAVRLPNVQPGWLNLMQAYLAREGALEEGERVVRPGYDEVQGLWQTLQESLKARDEALARRETAVEARKAAVKRLLALLKLAAETRVQLYYGGQVSPELQLWGYDVLGIE